MCWSPSRRASIVGMLCRVENALNCRIWTRFFWSDIILWYYLKGGSTIRDLTLRWRQNLGAKTFVLIRVDLTLKTTPPPARKRCFFDSLQSYQFANIMFGIKHIHGWCILFGKYDFVVTRYKSRNLQLSHMLVHFRDTCLFCACHVSGWFYCTTLKKWTEDLLYASFFVHDVKFAHP